MGPSLQEGTVPHIPHRHSSPSPPAPPRAALHRLQLWPEAAPAGISMGCSSFRPHPLLPHGLLHGCRWRSALPGAYRLQGDSLLHHVPLLEHLLSFCTVLSANMVASITFLTSLSAAVAQQCFPLWILLAQSTPTVDHGSALASADMGQLLGSTHRGHCLQPPATKTLTLPCKPYTQLHRFLDLSVTHSLTWCSFYRLCSIQKTNISVY